MKKHLVGSLLLCFAMIYILANIFVLRLIGIYLSQYSVVLTVFILFILSVLAIACFSYSASKMLDRYEDWVKKQL